MKEVLKILLPVAEFSDRKDIDGFTPRVWKEIQKCGIPYHMYVYVHKDDRQGELPARNRLFEIALQDKDWKYCVTLSNDLTSMPDNWGKTLVDLMDSLPESIGAVDPYVIPEDLGADTIRNIKFQDGAEVGEFGTACLIIRRKVLEEVGLLDTGFGVGGGMEHWDYVNRMKEKGYKNVYTTKVIVFIAVAKGNNFPPTETNTYYNQKWKK
jgi:GT2 family glycosyltransferase